MALVSTISATATPLSASENLVRTHTDSVRALSLSATTPRRNP